MARTAITPATTARFWDVATRKPTGTTLAGHATTVNAFAPSADGRLIAAGDSGGHVVLHDARTGAVVSDIDLETGIYDLEFSANGQRLAVGTLGDAFGVVYDVSNPTAPVPVSQHLGGDTGTGGTAVTVGFDATGALTRCR